MEFTGDVIIWCRVIWDSSMAIDSSIGIENFWVIELYDESEDDGVKEFCVDGLF